MSIIRTEMHFRGSTLSTLCTGVSQQKYVPRNTPKLCENNSGPEPSNTHLHQASGLFGVEAGDGLDNAAGSIGVTLRDFQEERLEEQANIQR